MQIMDRRIMLNLPSEFYERIKRIAEKEYKSVSGLIRESILEKIEEEFSTGEMDLIEKGHKSFHAGKGTNWRKIKHD